MNHEGKILQQWLNGLNITPDELAGKLKVAKQTVYYHLGREKIGDSFKRKLSQIGSNPFDLSNTSTQGENAFIPYNAKPVSTGNGTLTLVPLKAQGGFLNGYANRVFKDSLDSFPFPLIKGEGWGFEVEGYSMVTNDEMSLKPGDYVIGTEIPDEPWLSKGKVYVFVTVEGICVKLFDRIEGGEYYLKSANPEYNPVKPIPVKEVKKIYFKEGTYSPGN